MNAEITKRFETLLSDEKARILQGSSRMLVRDAMTFSQEDLPDEADLAAAQINQNLALRLREREQGMLQRIELALQRIRTGEFGLCMECEGDIGVKRLEVRPFSTLCIHCAEQQERKEKIYA